jgi:hypothetical protein
MISLAYLHEAIAEKKMVNKNELSLKTSVWRKEYTTGSYQYVRKNSPTITKGHRYQFQFLLIR